MRFVTTANNSVPVFSTGGFAVSLFSDMTSASKPLFINKGLLQSDHSFFGYRFPLFSDIQDKDSPCLEMLYQSDLQPRSPAMDYRGYFLYNTLWELHIASHFY